MQKFPVSLDRRKKSSAFSVAINVILVILIVVLVLEVTFFARFKRYYVVGESMSPTLTGAETDERGNILAGGDYVYADTMAVPQRFDIVIINADNGRGQRKTIIKRVIGLEGDKVELERGVLYINDERIDEPYVDPQNNDPEYADNTVGPYIVDEGCIFVLGDNRTNSSDSRSDYGMIELDEVIGVVEEWSMDLRWLVTPVSTFFDFTLPSLFSGCAA